MCDVDERVDNVTVRIKLQLMCASMDFERHPPYSVLAPTVLGRGRCRSRGAGRPSARAVT